MRIHRIIAGVVSGALLGLVPVALAAPAHAADYTTVTAISADRRQIEFKGYEYPYIKAYVQTSTGASVYYGDVDLQAKVTGGDWKTVATKTASGTVYFSDVVPKQNTTYRAVYRGGASSSDTFQGSESGNVKIKVRRKLDVTVKNSRKRIIQGKIAPKYKKKKVVIHKKFGKKWKKYRTVKTNKKSVFTVKINTTRKGHKFRFTVPGNKKYQKTVYIQKYSLI